MTLSPTCAVTPDTSKTDDSDFDDILAEILAEEEARVVKNPTSGIGQKKKVKRTKKKNTHDNTTNNNKDKNNKNNK